MLDKTFNPGEAEDRIYARWEDSGAFKAGDRPGAENFCIVIPPPNVTGSLHIGHALNNTLQDALCRYERMRGKNVLWQPGTDHAGIATQLVVERKLAERQMSRKQMGREKFLEEVWRWKEESGGTIVRQLRKLGASCDWSRERFTMDPGQMSQSVIKAFVALYKEGLIYKDKRLVNWDPRLQTAVSDLEVENIEIKGKLYYIRYPLEDDPGEHITVATTRPETMLGDVAVAVHPENEKLKHYIGRMLTLPLANRKIPVIADEYADPEKGTGAVKITPGHDFNDYAVGKRHGLEVRNIFTPEGTLNDTVPVAYRGMDRFEAREHILARLETLELLDKVEQIVHAVPHDEKTKTVVLEPYLTEQWYLNVTPLAEKAIAAVEDGRTKIVPDQWRNVYFNWLRNIQPWCISRQLWWGHQIPAWYGPLALPDPTIDPNKFVQSRMFVALDEDEALEQARQEYAGLGAKVAIGRDLADIQQSIKDFVSDRSKPLKIYRDEDVLDTWFSSALWPFSTLGWPEKTPELVRFYPTSVLVTAFDIIFFWVARMMMMGIHFMAEVPFHNVFIHNRVLDERGQKMSKIKGNVVDPLDLIGEYGADALRFALCLAAGQGRDMRLGASRVETCRNFGTKLWNAARFCEMNNCAVPAGFAPAKVTATGDRWILGELARAGAEMEKGLAAYRFNDSAGALYHFVYDVFCDWYLELIKPVLNGAEESAKAEARATAAFVRDNILKLLHPFMPFITEELWSRTGERAGLLMQSAWPDLAGLPRDESARAEVELVIEAIRQTRSIRTELNVPPSAKVPLYFFNLDENTKTSLTASFTVMSSMARLSEIGFSDHAEPGSVQFATPAFTAALQLSGVIDFAKERARLEKEVAKADAEIKRFDAKLANEAFVSKAPEEVIEEQREKRAEAAALKQRLGEALGRLN